LAPRDGAAGVGELPVTPTDEPIVGRSSMTMSSTEACVLPVVGEM
jgi:hypothetical protein